MPGRIPGGTGAGASACDPNVRPLPKRALPGAGDDEDSVGGVFLLFYDGGRAAVTPALFQ